MSENDLQKALSTLVADITPKKLPTNEEIFGKGADIGNAKDLGFAELLDGLTPKKLPTNEEIFGDLAKLDTTAFDELLKLFAPDRLISYDDLGKLLGFKF